MKSIEGALLDVGKGVDYPETPSIAERVMHKIEAGEPPEQGFRWRPAWAVLVTIAAFAIAVSLLLAFSPTARRAVADFLGVRGIRVFFMETGTPSPRSDGDLLLGTKTTLEEARSLADFEIAVPSELGSPDEVYFREPPVGGQVSFRYLSAGDPLLVIQFQGSLNTTYYSKVAGSGTSVRSVDINGIEGLWISGQPHIFLKDARNREFRQEVRLAGNVLIWEEEGVTYRIEGQVSEEEAIRVAKSML